MIIAVCIETLFCRTVRPENYGHIFIAMIIKRLLTQACGLLVRKYPEGVIGRFLGYIDLTGNAWAALGMLRVQVTIMKTPFAYSMKNETHNLSAWIKEILDGTFAARVCFQTCTVL